MKNPMAAMAWLVCASTGALAQSTYDEALARAQADAARGAGTAWFETDMRKAVSGFVSLAVQQCIDKVGPPGAADLSVVAAIRPDGRVAKTFFAAPSVFAKCLDGRLKRTVFPRPGDEAYFAVIVRK